MRRALSVVLIVAGLVVAAIGSFQAITTASPKIVLHRQSAPATFSLQLPKGNWTVFGRTAANGGVTTFQGTVTGPDGKAVPVAVSATPVLKTHGEQYSGVLGASIPVAGTYRFQLTMTGHRGGYPVVIGPTVIPTAFPWAGIAVDGLVGFLIGVGLLVLEARQKRHEELVPPQGRTPPAGGPPPRTLVAAP